MRRRNKQDNSPQTAEAVAAFLVVVYLAIQYGPSNWVVVITCVIAMAVIAGAGFLFWKRHARPDRREETKSPTVDK